MLIDDPIIQKTITAPDNSIHIVRLPQGHWLALDWLIREGFTSFERTVAIAWDGWQVGLQYGTGSTFETALGYAIQEIDIQYDNWTNGFSNDNPEGPNK